MASLIERLGQTGGVRRRNRAAKWFDPEVSARDERRQARVERGTVAEQKAAYRDYLERTERQLETATRGQMLTPRARESGVRTSAVLTMTPAAMRKNLSEEALRHFGEHGPPLSFDAWRYANLGARDKRAVSSWQRRTGSYFSEHG